MSNAVKIVLIVSVAGIVAYWLYSIRGQNRITGGFKTVDVFNAARGATVVNPH